MCTFIQIFIFESDVFSDNSHDKKEKKSPKNREKKKKIDNKRKDQDVKE